MTSVRVVDVVGPVCAGQPDAWRWGDYTGVTFHPRGACQREIFPRTGRVVSFRSVAAKNMIRVDFADARPCLANSLVSTDAPDVEKVMDAVVPWIPGRFGARCLLKLVNGAQSMRNVSRITE